VDERLMRFLLYGLFGWCAEIVWSATYDVVSGTRRAPGDTAQRRPLTRAERWRLQGTTYLWMLPIYGAGGLLFERLHRAVVDWGWSWPLRGGAYMLGAFAVEAAAGLGLRALTGRCPWDYSYARASVGGVIRLDYAPVWFAFGLVLERVQRFIAAVAH
jgi:hypothetical protein